MQWDNRFGSPLWVGLCGMWVLLGCGSDDGPGAMDQPDATMPDAGPQAEEDAGTDAGTDAGRDAGEDAGTDAGLALEQPWFEIWRELRAGIRQSPDHLPARAEALVEAGDPEALFAFVRDEITTTLPDVTSDGELGRSPLMGPRATLRAGAGTPLDKVQLLIDLYRRAGFEAELTFVVSLAPERRDVPLILRPRAARTFAPAVESEDLARFEALLGAPLPEANLEAVDADGSFVQSTSEQLRALVAPPTAPYEPPATFDFNMPVARVTIDGEETFANPLFADAELGQSYAFVSTDESREPLPYPEVSVRLWMSHTDAGAAGVTLVEGQYATDVLMGRRLLIRTAPLLSTEVLLGATPDQVQTVMPVIEVSGPDLSAEEGAMLHRAGPPLSTAGALLQIDDDGALVVDGIVYEQAPDPAAVRDQASSLDGAIDALRFEDVGVELSVRDESGEALSGLGASDFEVREEGRKVLHTLHRNREVLRVLFLVDDSGSIPMEFRGQFRLDLADALADRVLQRSGGHMSVTEVDTRTFTQWTDQPAEVRAQVEALAGISSSVYGPLAAAADRGADLVMLLTDLASEPATESELEAIRQGPPSLILRVNDNVSAADAVVALNGGSHVLATDTPAAVAALDALLDQVGPSSAYELRYVAPTEGPAMRNVQVTLRGTDLRFAGNYQVPAAELRRPRRAISGLHLSVTVGDRTVTRTLAGLAPGAPAAELTTAHVEAVSEALLGLSVLGFEGLSPPLSVVLDEWLGEKLRLEPLWDARGDVEAFAEVIAEGGIPRLRPEWIALMGDDVRSSDGELTFTAAPRIFLWNQQPRFGSGTQERIDLLPFIHYRTSGTDRTAAWRQTLDKTLHIAALENALGDVTTSTLLEGETLIRVLPTELASTFGGHDNLEGWSRVAASYGAGTTLVVPEDGDPLAHWAIETATGSARGMLPNGSGGVDHRTIAQVERNLAFFDMLENLAGMGAITGGAWLDLELAKARQASYATLWIATLGSEGPRPPDPTAEAAAAAEAFVRGRIEDRLLGVLPGGWGDGIGRAMALWGAVSGE